MFRKDILKNTIIIVVITVSIIIAIEVILRIIFFEKVEKAYKFDSDYLISLKPNQSKVFQRSIENGNDVIIWKTNKDSFRGEELRNNPNYRVLVIGDSNIQARFSKLENTFTKQLEKYLLKDIEDVEVINAGIVGAGPDQSLIRFKKLAPMLKPNLVVFHVFCDNDFGDILRNNLVEINLNGGVSKTQYKRYKSKKLKLLNNILVMRALNKISLKVFQEKFDVENIDYVNKLYQQTQKEYLDYKEGKSGDHFYDYYDIDISIMPNIQSSKLKIKLMDAILKEANQFAKDTKIKFVILIQPSKVDLVDDLPFSYKDLQKYPDYKQSNQTQFLQNMCESNNIDFINLFNVFFHNNPQYLFFSKNDNHWNDFGQKLAAEKVAEYIVKKYKL